MTLYRSLYQSKGLFPLIATFVVAIIVLSGIPVAQAQPESGEEPPALQEYLQVDRLALKGGPGVAGEPGSQGFIRSFDVGSMDIVVQSKVGEPYLHHAVNIRVRKDNNLIINKTHEIVGVLLGSQVTDLDRDHDLEIVIWGHSPGTGKYGIFALFEIEGGSLQTAKFPPLPKSLRSGYGGHDRITISSISVIRTFPLYRKSDANCCPTGPIVEIVYGYEQGRMVVEHIRTSAGDSAGKTQGVIAWKNEKLSCELLAQGQHDGLCIGGFLYPLRRDVTGVRDDGHLLWVAYTTPIHAAGGLTIAIDGPRSVSCRDQNVSISLSDAALVLSVDRDDDPRTRCKVSYTRTGRVVTGTFTAVMKMEAEPGYSDLDKYQRTSGAFRVTLPRPDDYINATIQGSAYTDKTGHAGGRLLYVRYRPVDNRYPHFRRGRNITDISVTGPQWTINIPEIGFSGLGRVTCDSLQADTGALIVFKAYAGNQPEPDERPAGKYTAGAGHNCTIEYRINPDGVVTGTFSGTLMPSDDDSNHAPITVTHGQFRFYLPDGPTT